MISLRLNKFCLRQNVVQAPPFVFIPVGMELISQWSIITFKFNSETLTYRMQTFAISLLLVCLTYPVPPTNQSTEKIMTSLPFKGFK